MTDVSDITQTRDVTYSKPSSSSSAFSTVELTAGPDLFSKPCILDVSDNLLSMFKYTMKKRKFPFVSEESDENQAEKPEEDVEQTRRLSEISVRDHCFLHACIALFSLLIVYGL